MPHTLVPAVVATQIEQPKIEIRGYRLHLFDDTWRTSVCVRSLQTIFVFYFLRYLLPICSVCTRHRQMVIVFGWCSFYILARRSIPLPKNVVREMSVECIDGSNSMLLTRGCASLEFFLKNKKKNNKLILCWWFMDVGIQRDRSLDRSDASEKKTDTTCATSEI